MPDGTTRYHEARGRIEHDSQGRVIRLFGSALDITERKRAEMALQNLVEGTAATTGEDFFPALVRHIAAALEVDYATVGEVVGENLHILASWANGTLHQGGFVTLAHTPCQRAFQDGLFYCQEAVKVQCPEFLLLEGMDVQSYLGIALRDAQGQPIGSLCILDNNPLQDFSKAESLLRVFGARAAAELERKRADQALEQLNQALERKVEERTAALRASEQRYATLAAFAPVAIFRFDQPFNCTYVSDRWSEMTGRPIEAALGQGWLEAIHPEDRAHFWALINSEEDTNLLERLLTHAFEGRHLLPDGTIRWFYAQVTTETDEQGEVIGCIGTLTDITERKRIEAELIESEAKYRCLVEDSTDLIWMAREGRFTYLSPQFQTLFGWETQEWIGKIAAELVHPEDAQAVVAAFNQGEQKHSSRIEFRHRHQNGSYLWVQGSATAIYNADGETIGLQGIISDIHDRKCAELALQESEAQLRRLATNIPGMIYRYVLHANGQDEFTYVSSGIRELYELEPDVVQQSSRILWDTIYTEDIPKLQVEIAKSAEHLTPFLVEHRVVTPDGRFKWIQLMSRPARQANGDILWDGVALDLTHQKQTEQQLRDSEAFLDGILNAITDYIFVKDEQHRWVRFNQAFCELVGAPREQLINRSDYDFFSPEEAEVFWEKDNQVLASGQENLNEEWITHPTQGTRLVATKKTCFQDSTGRKLLVGYSRDITEHKQAERQIQEQEQFLRSIYEGVTQPIFVIDVLPDGRLQQGGLNPAAAQRKQQLAMAREHQSLAEMLKDTVAPYETEAAIVENCRHCIETQQPLTLEECLSLPDQTLWTLSTYNPLVNASGQVYRIVCTVYDITDRKQAEIQVQESQRFLQTVIDTFPLSVFWKDRNSVYLGCNQNFLLDAGCQSISDVIGKTDYDMPWGQTEADAYRADDQQVIAQNTPKLGIIEPQIQHDGQQIWLETSKLPLHNFEGQVIGVLGTYQNITHRIQSEAELAKSRQQYYSLIQSVKGIVWEYNLHTDQFTFVSDKAEAILGYPLSDWLTEPHFWQNHVYTPDRAPALRQWEAALEQQTTCEMEYRMVAADGQLVWIYDISSLIFSEGGVPTASNGILLDVSDRKQVEIQLQQQSRQKLLLWHITQTIRQSLDLEQTLDATVKEVKQLLGANRAVVYRFTPPQGGVFVAEDVDPDWVSLLHPPLYKLWENLYFQEAKSGRFQNYETIVIDDIYIANLQPWHINLLEQIQAQAYAITPIFVGDTLWGLVGVYQNDTPRQWTVWETELLQQIAIQLAIAIQQGSLYDQVQSELLERQQAEKEIALQLRRQQALGAITQSIRESLDINSILATATHQVKDVLQADRVIVFRLFPAGRIQVVEESVAEPFPALKNQFWENETWPQSILSEYWQGNPRIAYDVSKDNWADWIIEHTSEGQIKSRIAAPILQEVMDGGENCWVSPSGRNALWGLLVVHACQDTRIWLESEAQLLQQIANQLAIAMQQARLFEKLQQELAERQQAQQQLTQFNQQLVQSNEELARATQMKDEFLANMSHELRTPLNAILGMTEGLQEAIFGAINERQSHALATIERSSSHLLGLINDILDLAKIEAGQVELECKPTVVSLLCKSSLSFVNQQALSKRIQIETVLPPHLPDLWGDERRLRQVLINLLNNAVKFTSQGGRITLNVQVYPLSKPVLAEPPLPFDSMLHISVIDTGIGIAPENLPKLFKPFSQIDSALNRQYTGTGLGLSLVKRIVELHGGSVEVVSEVGIGSCFTVMLPYRIPPTLSPVSEVNSDPTNEAAQDFSNVQCPLILLAEDNEANISTVSSYLGAKGYRITLARNGEEVIAKLETEPPDLILMDIQMPNMDGLEAIHQIRSKLGLTQIPIVALTALAMNNDEERCLAAGANAYLTKPVKLKQLVTTIQSLLGH
ncbi:MAG TPA: PAS domain S-box protein [Stenomitos sp.]